MWPIHQRYHNLLGTKRLDELSEQTAALFRSRIDLLHDLSCTSFSFVSSLSIEHAKVFGRMFRPALGLSTSDGLCATMQQKVVASRTFLGEFCYTPTLRCRKKG